MKYLIPATLELARDLDLPDNISQWGDKHRIISMRFNKLPPHERRNLMQKHSERLFREHS
jgi:hypothetical protein